MIRIELTDEEAARLRDVCEDYLADLRAEIAGTESHDFREELKAQEAFLKGLMARLGAGAA